jgi:peptide methionine sulfoxide reductase MsrB
MMSDTTVRAFGLTLPNVSAKGESGTGWPSFTSPFADADFGQMMEYQR